MRYIRRALWVVLLVGSAASDSTADLRFTHATGPGPGRLIAYGARGPAGSAIAAKFDGVLADIAHNHSLARPAHLLTDLRSLSPAAQFRRAQNGVDAEV